MDNTNKNTIVIKFKMPFILIENTADLVDYCFCDMFKKVASFSEGGGETVVTCEVSSDATSKYGDLSNMLDELIKLVRQAIRPIIIKHSREYLSMVVTVETPEEVLANIEYKLNLPKTRLYALQKLASYVKTAA